MRIEETPRFPTAGLAVNLIVLLGVAALIWRCCA